MAAEYRPEVVREERSFGELFGRLTEDMSLLMRQEVQLVKAEMKESVSRTTKDFVAVGAGGLVALAGGLTLVAALVLGLVAIGVSPWLSALIVGLVLAGVGFSMLKRGLGDLKRVDITPRRTVETLKDDVQWAKEQRS
ncbi:MAG: phage holin family protein, partial [Gemmatimonadales bacterium]|nr:phage holin family protein [Gemmatimonadales bacterium]